MGCLSKTLGNIPIIGSVAKGLDEVVSRPGDLINNPGKFIGDAAMGAAPFLAGPLAGALGTAGTLPAWATTAMGAGGGMLSAMAGGKNPINSLTNPMGVRLFPGGPYADSGLGDKQLNVADQFGGYGKQMMDRGMTLPDPSNMGWLSNAGNIFDQQAQMAGVKSPTGFTPQGYDASNPYALFGPQQTALNQQYGQSDAGTASAIDQNRHRMTMNGITDPRATAAYEAQMRIGNMANKNQALAGAQNQAFTTRNNTVNSFMPQMQNLFGAQQGQQNMFLSHGQNALNSSGGFYGQGAQRAIGMNDNANTQAGKMAGLGVGGGAGINPMQRLFNPNTWKMPWQSGGNSGSDANAQAWGINNGGFDEAQYLYQPYDSGFTQNADMMYE